MTDLKPLRILFFIPEDWYVCSHRLPLLRGAIAKGYEVVVVTRVTNHAGPILETGARLVPASLKRGFRNPLDDLVGLIELMRIYKREKPDIVHHVTPKSVLFGSLAAWLTRIPAVINALAGLGLLFASNKWYARLLRPIVAAAFRFLLARGNSQLIVQNRDDEEYFAGSLGIARQRIKLIRGAGVDVEEFHPVPAPPVPPYRVCVVSRMLFEKGIAEAVEAAVRIGESRDDVQILLAGEPDLDNPMGIPVARLETWSKENNVEWLGRVSDVAGLVQGCHVALLPTYYREGLPKSLLEAAACGLPLVATDVAGCREICHDGVNGILIPPRDVPAIVEAVLRLIDDAGLRERMGHQSRALVESEFKVEKVVDQTMDLYREMRV
ncbi:MAG: glycosyltransferase family 4 protein [Gemmatimonadales bacterium]|nr:glycosyltransferase family 4 protein [Gemmatimonadales bacterium]